MFALTGLWAFIQLVDVSEGILDNVQDGQQGACEPQQFTEAVEAKVDQVPCQVHHLGARRKSSSVSE